MSSPTIPVLGSSFQQPQNPDQTSSPAVQLPNAAGVNSGTPDNPVVQALKKKKPFGPNVKNPGALARSIQNRAKARAARPNQTSDKWGAP